jgi:hypothetical protein
MLLEDAVSCNIAVKNVRRVARSVLSAEHIAFADAYYRGYSMAFDLSDMLGRNVPLKLYTDSKGLFDVITRG